MKNIKLRSIMFLVLAFVVIFSSICGSAYALTRPSKPVVRITQLEYNKVKLSWNKVKKAKGYEVYKYNSKSKKYIFVARIKYTGLITSKNVELGKRNYYKVRAYKTIKGKRVYSLFRKVSIVPRLSVPTINRVSKYNNKEVLISWRKVKGASGYDVYKENSNNKYEYIGSSNITMLVSGYKLFDSNVTSYKVRAYRIVSGKKIYSNYSKEYGFVVGYYFDINSYSAGDIITLKDGSKWFYLTSDGYYANLLSLNMVDENGEFVEDAWNAIKMNFSNDNSSDYETSDVKKFIDTKVALSIKQNLKKNGVSDDIINDIDISILDAKIVSDIGQIDSWTPSAQGYFSIGVPSRYFLANRSLTYWTKTAKNANYVWIVNKSNNFWYGQAGSTNNLFGVKPMITVKLNNIKNIENVVENPELSAISSPKYLVYDVTNKKIILEENDARNDIWHPASLTKLTTAIVAIEEMEKQNISLDDKITITDEVMSMVPSGASVAGFKAGDVVTYRDLLYGTIHKSGGDACYVLAESLAGSTASFVQFMNDFATTNNMTNTHYTNTTGLINTNYQHYSSLRDVAIGFAEAMKNDTFREILKPIEYTTSNGLVFPIPEFGTLPYVIGLKNGHATYYDEIKSGYNQANYYQKGSREYIVVTSSSPDDKTMEHRTTDNYLLWKWLF